MTNPSYANAIFVQSTRTQRFLINILTLSCFNSLESSHLVLSDEYPCARVSVIFSSFCIGKIAHQQHKGQCLHEPRSVFPANKCTQCAHNNRCIYLTERKLMYFSSSSVLLHNCMPLFSFQSISCECLGE